MIPDSAPTKFSVEEKNDDECYSTIGNTVDESKTGSEATAN